MGRIIRKPGVVPAVSTPTGIAAILSGTLANQIVTLSWTMLNGGYRMLVYRRMKSEEDVLPGYPYNWERQNALPLGNSNTSYVDTDLWEGEQYTYRLIAVDANGNRSAPVDVGPITVAAQAGNLTLNHWSEDLSRVQWGTGGNGYAWTYGNGATATLQAGYSQVTFSAGSQSVDQVVPTYDLNGRTYTVALLVQGTAGNTFQSALHNLTASQFQDYPFTIGAGLAGTGGDAGYEWFAFTRTFAAAGRHLGISLNTYGAATGRSLRVKKWFIVEGTFTAAQMAAQYQASQGPGSIWQQPLQVRPADTVSATSPRTFSSWHKSNDYSVHAIHNNADNGNLVVISGARVMSKGMFIYSQGFSRLRVQNNKVRILNPKLADKNFRHALLVSYGLQVWFEGNDIRDSCGIGIGDFWGRGGAANPDDTVKVRRNKFREIKGQRVDANGTPTRVPWAYSDSRKGAGVIGGFEISQFLIINKLDWGGGAQAGDYISGVEVAYNEIVGRPGYSRVEDVIHINIAGDAASPVRVHDNVRWVNYAHDYKAMDALTAGTPNPNWSYGDIDGIANTGPYSGTGLMPSDFLLFDSTNLTRNPNNILIYNELSIGPHGTFALYDTKNTSYDNCRTVNSGKTPDGLAQGTGYFDSGFQITRYLNNGYMQANSIRNYVNEGGQPQSYFESAATAVFTDNRSATRDNLYLGWATPDREWEALGQWREKMQKAGVVIGV